MEDRKRHTIKRIFRVLLIVVFWFAVWQGVSMIVNQSLFVPSVPETFSSLGGLVVTGEFWLSILMTLYRVVFGLVVAFVLGVSLAFLAAHAGIVEQLLRPLVTAVKSTPVMSIIVLALVWFNASYVPVFSCILLCFPIFYANTLGGIKSVERNYLELAKVYHVRRVRVIREVTIPSVLPNIYTALSIALGFSWKSVVAAEVLSSPKYSMGFNLYATKLYLDTPGLFAWTIAIIIISLIVERGLKRLLPTKGGAL